jgi:hypothetical protein
LRATRSAPAAAPRVRVPGRGAWAGRTVRRPWPLTASNGQNFKIRRHTVNQQEQKGAKVHSPMGRPGAW